MPAKDPNAAPAHELELGPAIRDVVAGAALLGIGLVTGGSSLDGQGLDRLDVFFDVVGGAWLLWGVARLVRRVIARR